MAAEVKQKESGGYAAPFTDCPRYPRRNRCPSTAPKALETVPDATHLFPEPGVLVAVVDLAAGWFLDHCVGGSGKTLGPFPISCSLGFQGPGLSPRAD